MYANTLAAPVDSSKEESAVPRVGEISALSSKPGAGDPRSLAPGVFKRVVHVPHSHRRRHLLSHHARKLRRLRRFLRRVRPLLMSSRPARVATNYSPNSPPRFPESSPRTSRTSSSRTSSPRLPPSRALSPNPSLFSIFVLRRRSAFCRCSSPFACRPPRREELLLIVLVHLEVFAQRAPSMVRPPRRRLARRAVAVAVAVPARAARAVAMPRERETRERLGRAEAHLTASLARRAPRVVVVVVVVSTTRASRVATRADVTRRDGR